MMMASAMERLEAAANGNFNELQIGDSALLLGEPSPKKIKMEPATMVVAPVPAKQEE